MPDGQIDPARLAGEELRRWFRRTPEEVERERQAAFEVRRKGFYSGKAPAEVQTGARSTGGLRAPPPGHLAELRRQQSEFGKVRREISKENSWMAGVALAPAAAVLGLEAGAAVAARLAPQVVLRGPLVLSEQMPYLRVGHNWATRAGQRAHQAMKVRVKAKPGWEAEEAIVTERGLIRPDVMALARSPAKPVARHLMELKPNTPSGRRAGARAAKRYSEATGNRTRVIYYDPKSFI